MLKEGRGRGWSVKELLGPGHTRKVQSRRESIRKGHADNIMVEKKNTKKTECKLGALRELQK